MKTKWGNTALRRRLSLLLLPLVGLLAIAPLMVHGCSCGHDFDFHIVSWLEAVAQFTHGNLHPQWAFTPAWNAGEPRFVFYPPLSWTLGAVLGLLLPWSSTPIVFTWIALSAAGVSCYFLLRDFVPPHLAIVVAALYSVNPYMLFTAYERTAYAELLTAAIFPLLLRGILRERVTTVGIALPLTLLWLSNAPAAVLGCYSLAVLAAGRLAWSEREPREGKRNWRPVVVHTVAGTALGLGLAAFYIIPADYQRRYIESALANAQSLLITDNFLFRHTGDLDHDTVLHTASLLAVGLLVFTLVCLLRAMWRRNRTAPRPYALPLLATLTLGIGFLLTEVSAPVWHYAPDLALLQFPWRFLAILAPVTALACALALDSPFARLAPRPFWTAFLSLLLSAVLIATGYHEFHQTCDPEDTVAARVAAFRAGAGVEPTDEYTPGSADDTLLGQANPPFWLGENADASPPPSAAPASLHWPLDVTAMMPQVLILNLRDYPAWRVSVNQHLQTERLQRDDGLLAVPLPAGHSRIEISYAHTGDQTAGWIVSAVSLGVLVLMLLRRRRSR